MRKLYSILKYLVPYWITAFWSIVFNLLSAVASVISFTMVIPFLGLLFSSHKFTDHPIDFSLSAESISHNFNFILGKIVSENGQLKALLFIIIIVFITTLLKNIFSLIAKTQIISIRTNVVKDVRNELMNKILDFDLSYFTKERKGDIISKMIVDVREIEQSIISSLDMLFKDPILVLVYLWVLFLMSAKLTFIIIFIFPLSALIIGQIGKSLKKSSFRGQQKMGALVSMLEEALSGIKVVKAFNAEKFISERFKVLNENYSNLFKKVWIKRNVASPVSDIISTITILLVIWFGGTMVLNEDGNLTSQIFIGYLAVFSQIINPAKSFFNGYYNVVKGMASVERINTILGHQFQITEIIEPKDINDFKKNIEFKDVSFSYDESDQVLQGVSLTIEKGKTIALVGHSGSGKSTIVDLLPRFYDPNTGEILLDGVNLKEYKINSLRNLFGYVNQEPVLFNDTIYNNILFGNPSATQSQVEEASNLSFAHDFIEQKELSYETNLGESGEKLSLGEKQRISIARALLKNPPILILDEATSALDYESELIVRKALQNLMKDRTTIVIAHRLSTIKNADKIVVVDQGKIVEQGTHEELLSLQAYYYKLSQLEFL